MTRENREMSDLEAIQGAQNLSNVRAAAGARLERRNPSLLGRRRAPPAGWRRLRQTLGDSYQELPVLVVQVLDPLAGQRLDAVEDRRQLLAERRQAMVCAGDRTRFVIQRIVRGSSPRTMSGNVSA